MNRWSKNGVLDRVFEHLQRERILCIKLEVSSIDSIVVKVHPDPGTEGLIGGKERIAAAALKNGRSRSVRIQGLGGRQQRGLGRRSIDPWQITAR